MSALTLAPLPTIRELVLSTLNSPLPINELIKPWVRNEERGIFLSRSAWSLSVIAGERMRLSNGKKITVWVPAYFCNSSLIPLREMGVQLVFYHLTDDLTPDLEWCRSKSEKIEPDLFVFVHFFGQALPSKESAQFCKDSGAWLIEDAAHVLRPIAGVGDFGDFILYSPHKHLAIPDGAILLARTNGPSRLTTDLIDLLIKDNFKDKTDGSRCSLYQIKWLAKRILQRLGIRGKNVCVPIWPDVMPEKIFLPPPPMSILAKRLLSVQIKSLDTVSKLRMKHFKEWEKKLDKMNRMKGAFKFNTVVSTPYLACVLGKNIKNTDALYKSLQQAKLPILTWPDLPPEVISNSKVFEKALHLRRTRIYLPVHQTLKLFDIEK